MFLIVLALGGVGADRVAHRLATDRAEEQLVAEGVVRPQVEIAGFPFLTQLLDRRFEEVRLRAAAVEPASGGAVSRVRATGFDVTTRDWREATVGRLRASGLVGYDTVLRQSGFDELDLSEAGRRVRIGATAQVLGRSLPVSVLARIENGSRSITLVPERVRVEGGDLLPTTVSAALAERFTLTVRLGTLLPRGMRLESVTPQRAGLRVTVTGSDVELRPPG